jgi:hypothetical protein
MQKDLIDLNITYWLVEKVDSSTGNIAFWAYFSLIRRNKVHLVNVFTN